MKQYVSLRLESLTLLSLAGYCHGITSFLYSF